jgi:hypothetical protein
MFYYQIYFLYEDNLIYLHFYHLLLDYLMIQIYYLHSIH